MPEVQLVLSAQSGAAGLAATLSAVRSGKIVALANKESLVLAGELIRKECAKSGAVLLPVDSEHNALFQAIGTEPLSRVRRLILTASGGPFLGKKYSGLTNVTPETALKHPRWSMGAKISIDSATLINKGLEVIEAHHLYNLPSECIDVLIHPESIIHSLVEFNDTSILAHLGPADMRVAIAHCMAWPERIAPGPEPINLLSQAQLTFEDVDHRTFNGLELARSTLLPGGPSPVVLNAANEIAVAAFLNKRLSFLGITELVRAALDEVTAPTQPQSEEEIMDLDRRTREWSLEQLRD
jgi:1-deoxy-D-xylulose-5-phosphate reductoisomerase